MKSANFGVSSLNFLYFILFLPLLQTPSSDIFQGVVTQHPLTKALRKKNPVINYLLSFFWTAYTLLLQVELYEIANTDQFWSWKIAVAWWVNLVVTVSCTLPVIVKWKEQPCVYRWPSVQSSPAPSGSKELEGLTSPVRDRAWLDLGWFDSCPNALISIIGVSKLLLQRTR